MEVSTYDRIQKFALVVGRVALAYLFFTQLFWKFPPSFGCPADYSFTTGTVESGRVRLDRTSGLCDWIGIETVWAEQPRPFFVADMRPINGPVLSVDLGWFARLNSSFLESFMQPNIRWAGWLVWGGEAFIFASLLLGVFSRLGGLTAILISGQLMIGLAGISNPYEWEWSYILMVVLSFVMLAFAPGRVFGLDARLRPSLHSAAQNGSRLAKFLLALT
ncbi:MAG TPA: hypothetical protein VLA49_10100 [Anaerolineales bacterium]|nr:hypothetical protein [Anaerolineales bacterium]